ncbi:MULTISPECIES: dihydrolipoyl dehydrogenase [unclassified Lentimonas]|uniref:dihydrolipoyl dehydrogenase n=1 Tax=unclassified Lentimonas TaxID=2630993 RepID=UPI00132814CF|nr:MULTISPECIES: dihydrolipoyl dehydrogenase [unclassified Lentimonas]CAA6677921.1 Dihydrolipoamide dehydrogenase of 2-oxoglutarate dehydrogenase (EC [Lentimonas sp. CC4]CAA6684025.1 Dihydrolipoamide dehydrogenase of 2-oxoglutarate dehydrogenase (EC [Lentimonas sp. CC6]CAA7076599.1 Dihydrolipoamide dehydrogenase of 2-oxoglutarate dehydrogenase (EC [Lentimonas sp. CC4]CAA7170072.1 Dihydrolipoamide dehydrogenase of 2-oxoglutarate dehydrogenase (EC [Lentimonas sp. CC21]CAA7181357.1 Dihydrolipoami
MSENNFDLVVIGSGPGGYVAAIRGAQLGLKTALVEKSKTLGGTCLNVGCIPSKALLHSTEMYHFAGHGAAAHGIDLTNLSISIEQLMAKKDKTVAQLCGGIQHLMKANKIQVFNGLGVLDGDNKVRVQDTTLHAKHIIIATGSTSIELPFLPFDGETVVSSTGAIAFKEVPEKLAVIGAGAIGLELGSVWARLGAEVNVIEFLPVIAPTYDKDVSKMAERLLKKQGLNFHLKTKVTGIKQSKGKQILTAEKAGKEIEFEVDKVLVAVGRKPYTDRLGLETVGITTDEKGRIPVDAHFKTSAPGIYAIGDVIPGPMLAHKAEEEAVACVERIAGQAGHVNYDVIPNVIYTDPEIASVGLGDAAAKEQGYETKVGKFNFAGNGRAIASDATDGFAKVVADKKTDRILGVQVIGKGASELIASAVAHMEYGGSAEDLARTVHAHPTISEAIKEAALAVDGNALHSA